MLRNREIKIYFFTMALISMAGIIAAAALSINAAVIIGIVSALLIITSFLFTHWRYREMEKLSGYLRQISSGDYTLDVRDNFEGELSILKNEMYKVTIRLSEQSLNLQEDKVKLTNAISDISHQLKTPLTSMTVMADLLSDANLPASKRKEFTKNIGVQLERIEWLVSSLLKLSKIDAGTISFKKDPVDVKRLIQKAVEPLTIPMEIKDQTLTLTGADTVTFLGDFNWTNEAILNILKNGVEHTPESGELRLSFSENALFTEIILSNDGKGIPKEDLPYIFKRFYKGKNASDESVGIGLAMAHSIITAQNGTIEVESRPNEGTQFHIKFYKQVI